jgi:hypothetical protein
MIKLGKFLDRGGVALIAIAICCLTLAKSQSYYGTLLRGFDAQFYYAAARSLVVSGEFDVTDDLPLSPRQAPFQTEYGFPRRPDSGILNVFPVGLSLLEAGLLVPARAVSSVAGRGRAAPGYTLGEVVFVAFGLLVLAALGVQLTYALVRGFATPGVAAGATALAWLGTPLFYYMGIFPFSAHPATFTIMVLLLVVVNRLSQTRRTNLVIFAFGVLAALLYLTRPQQTPYVVILTAWKILPLLRRGWREWLPGVGCGFACCGAAVAFQSAVHRLNVGSFSPLGHGRHDHPMISGHFDLLDPHFDVVLFSGARGLFTVTPIILLSLVGLVVRYRSVPWWGWAYLINGVVQTVILAFWSDPGQGDSFGIRLWSEHLPLVVCGIAVWMSSLSRTGRVVLGAVGGLCVLWTCCLLGLYLSNRLQTNMTNGDVFTQVIAVFNGPGNVSH